MKPAIAATLAILACVICVGTPANLAFEETVIPTGKGPEAVAVADLNRDGKPDLIVTNAEGGTVSILLGDGTGRFHDAPGSPFAVGHLPNDIGIGDMNGDGIPDLVIPNTQTPNVSVFLGNGKGGFRPSPQSPFETASRPHPHGVAVGDFTGDGKLDAMIDSWGRNQINLLAGDGDGNLLTRGRMFDVGKRPYQRLRSADFNKDGHPDIVTTNLDGNNVSILLGDGKGGFRAASFPTGPAPWDVALDDIDKDGNVDLLTIPYSPDLHDPSDNVVTILRGDGKGGFGPMRNSPLPLTGCQRPNRVAAGDLDGDGLRDIVVSCLDGHLAIFLGSRHGGFQSQSREVGRNPYGVAIADLNGDGRDDIVVANGASGTITVLVSPVSAVGH